MPAIAIVGRPNVGKSTLFNRLLGARRAIVSPMRGTTRDRLYGQLAWRGVALTLIDTGGLELAASHGLTAAVQQHIQRALQDAESFVLVCDAQEGLVPADAMIVERLRKTGKPMVLVANKAERHLAVPPEFFSLGIEPAFPVSALHGLGTGALLDHLVERLVPTSTAASGAESAPALAIVGRQNVGKSSLLNAFLREERVVVSDVPGTTRDPVDTSVVMHGQRVTLIDTAGLRHKRKVTQPLERVAMSRALRVIDRCDVALVVLDAAAGVTRDDQRIVTHVCDAGRGLVLLVNKWDILPGGREARLAEALRRALPAAGAAPVVAVSAKTGYHVAHSLTAALRVAQAMRRGLSDAEASTLMQQAWKTQPPPRYRGRTIRLHRVRWLPGYPPRCELLTSPAGRIPTPYQRYLLKCLWSHPRLAGVPVRLSLTAPT